MGDASDWSVAHESDRGGVGSTEQCGGDRSEGVIAMFVEYPKIETIYERDMEGTRKLIDGKFRDPLVEYLAPLPWICTEKVDGTNTGIVWDGHEVRFQGRTEKTNHPKALLEYLNATFKTNEAEELFEQMFGEKKFILYGEGYGAKIQKVGNLYREDNSFILFDVYAVDSDIWLRRKDIEEIAKAFGIDCVPIYAECNLYTAVELVKEKRQSRLNANAPLEGFVCKPLIEVRDRQGKRVMVKVKARDFE